MTEKVWIVCEDVDYGNYEVIAVRSSKEKAEKVVQDRILYLKKEWEKDGHKDWEPSEKLFKILEFPVI